MNTYKLIYDEQEVRDFFNSCMPRLAENEVYFFSLSSRNKYLTQEERVEYDLGRTEMFAKSIVKEDSANYFIKKIRRLECDTRGFTTRNGKEIPAKTLILYININPINTIKAYSQFVQKSIEELTNSNAESKNYFFKNIESKLFSYLQQSIGTKSLIDIDFDIDKEVEIVLLHKFLKDLDKNDCKYYIIETKSGFHVLLDKSTLKHNFYLTIVNLNDQVIKGGEIVVNKNGMIPLPGTLQGGFEVKRVKF